MKKYILLFMVLTLSVLGGDRIAILDFEGEGVPISHAKTFTDRVRTALVGYTQFEVMEREKFEAILEEQAFQLSGLCDEDCIVEVGQIAGVQYMVTGDIRDLGNTLYVSASFIDVESSKVMASQDMTVSSNDIQALLEAAPELADKLTQQFSTKKGLVAGGAMAIVDHSEFGKLRLTASETGTQLVIDGRSRGTIARSDFVIQLTPGQHDVQLSKDGFEPWASTVAIELNKTTTRTVELKSTGSGVEQVLDWSFLTIQSTPEQAQVVIDGIEYGQTFFNDKVAPGKHTISLSKPLYYPAIKEVVLEPGEITPLEMTLKPNFGSIAISSVPPNASIMINDRIETQRTPHTVTHLQSGQYELKVSAPDYRDFVQTVTISDDIESKIEATLTPAFGWLNITSNPNESEIILDGRPIGTTPLGDYRIPSGEYVLTLRKQYYKDYQEQIIVEDGKPFTLYAEMNPDFGKLSVQGFPEGAKILIDGELRGQVAGMIEPVSVGSHKVRIEAGKHFKPYEQEVFIGLNEMAGMQVNLKELTGSLIVSTNPTGASIEIDGKMEKSITPYTIPKLWLGDHEVVFKLNGYAESSHTVNIAEDEREVLHADLEKLIYVKPRKEALWRSAVLPGLGQYYEDRPLWGTIYIAAQASLLFTLVSQRSEYEDLHQDYLDKRLVYSEYEGPQAEIAQVWDEVQTAYDLSESNYEKQQLTIGLMVGAYVWNVADAWFFMPRRTESNISTAVISDGKSVSAQIRVNLP